MAFDEESKERNRLVATLVRQGAALKVAGQLTEALEKGKEAIDLARLEGGWKTQAFRASVNFIASVYFDLGNYVTSRALFEWLSRTAASAGDDRRSAATWISNRAHCLMREGYFDESGLLLQKSFEALVDVDVVGALQSMHGAALSAFSQGRYRRAAELHELVLNARRQILPADDPELATSLHNLADSLLRTGEIARAAELSAEAIHIWRTIHEDAHPHVINGLLAQAHILHLLGEYGQAAPIFRRLIELIHAAEDEDPELLRELHSRLASCLARLPPAQQPDVPHPAAPDPFAALTRGADLASARIYARCLRSFMARDYAACVGAALELSQGTQRHDVMQLLSISLRRLALDEIAENVADWSMKIAADTSFQALLACTAGRLDYPAAAAVAAQGDLEKEAAFYGGCRRLMLGEIDAAIEMFELLVSRHPRSLEAILALPEVIFRGVPVDSAATPSSQQVEEFAQSVHLLQAKREIALSREGVARLADAGKIDEAVVQLNALSDSLSKRENAFAEECASTLNFAAHILYTSGRHEESLPYYERSLAILRANSAHPVILGAVSNNLGNLYTKLGKHADAIRMQVEALAHRRAANGPCHPSILLSHLDLALAHREAGEAAAAAACCEEARKVASAGLAKFPSFVKRLQFAVNCALTAADLEAALGPLREAVRVWETENHDRRETKDLQELSRILLESGQLDRAESTLQEALQILPGEASADQELRAECLYDLGRVYEARGNRNEAAGYFRQGLDLLGETTTPLKARFLVELAESVSGTEGESSAREAVRIAGEAGEARIQAAGWHALGKVFREAAKSEQATGAFRQALALRAPYDVSDITHDLFQLTELALENHRLEEAESYLGEFDSLTKNDLPIPLSAASNFLRLRGCVARSHKNFSGALTLFRSALDRQTMDAPTDDSLRADILTDLGLAYLENGETEMAVVVLTEAGDRLSGRTGQHPARLGLVFSLLAGCEYSLGRLATASEFILKARELLEPVLAEGHLLLADLWRTAGRINRSAGAYRTAESQFQMAREIFMRQQGPESAVASVDFELAILKHLGSRWEDSLATMSRVAAVFKTEGGSTIEVCQWQAYTLAALGRKTEAIEKSLELLDLLTEDFQSLRAAMPSTGRARFAVRIRKVLDQILSLAIDPALSGFSSRVFAAVQRSKAIGAETFFAQREFVRSAHDEAVRARWREIAELQSLIGRTLLQHPDQPLTPAEREKVRRWELRAGDLERDLVGGKATLDLFSEASQANVKTITDRLSPGEMLIEYVRFQVVDSAHLATSPVAGPNAGRFCAIALLRVDARESAVRLFDLGDSTRIEKTVQEFREAIVNRREIWRMLGDELRAALLDPVLAESGTPSALIVAPDGALNAMPFDALPQAEGHLLIDAFPISFVDLARDVVRFGRRSVGNDPVVIAAPDFSLNAELGSSPPTTGLFTHLKGAEKEGRAVGMRLGVKALIGADAVESALRAVSSPRILHLATHGFFIPKGRYEGRPDVFDSLTILKVPGEGQYLVGASQPTPAEDLWALIHSSRLENPLLRSGLALAGANTWLAGGTLPVAAEDGIVTSLDVTGLDLAETELVVLSACETGLGEIEAGEGVLGLRRAFLLAGANTVIVSLWKVADQATTVLMDEFYRRLLIGESRAGALRHAKLYLRSQGFEDPVFWAAFICLGDPSPPLEPLSRQDPS